jgi:hypothetical protein
MAILTEPRRSVGAFPNRICDLRYDVLRSFHNVIRHFSASGNAANPEFAALDMSPSDASET